MRKETRYISNYFWSIRWYIKSALSDYKVYYNPSAQPKPTNVNEWLILILNTYRAETFAKPTFRIICVAREGNRGNEIIDIATDVMNAFDSQASQKHIDFYHKQTRDKIGRIDILDIQMRPPQPYDTGINSIALDIYTRMKTKRSIHVE